MNFDPNDPNWWSALSAGLALLVAITSLYAAIVSNRTAKRSANADELASQLAKALARTCHARWETKTEAVEWEDEVEADKYAEFGRGAVTVTNVGEEVAFNVSMTGGWALEHEPIARIQPGESGKFPFAYELGVPPDERLEVRIEWDRPKEFGDERMSVQRFL